MLVAGASGFAGALGRRSSSGATRGCELVAVTVALGRRQARSTELYPRYRVPLTLEELDLDRIEACDAAIVAYPHGAAAPTVAALRGRGAAVVDLSRRLPPARPRRPTREWYGEPAAPELLAEAVYGLPELYRERLQDARRWSRTRAATRPRRCSRSPRSPPRA